jgi:hypothetical protein
MNVKRYDMVVWSDDAL